MTWTEVSQFGTMLAAVVAAVVGWRNGRRIIEVQAATNGMKTELVDAVRNAALAKGRLEGAAAEHARSTHDHPRS